MNTRTLSQVEKEIAAVTEELKDVHGTQTEVYARIVGYYRSVRNWNKGKKDEFKLRKNFVMEDDRILFTSPSQEESSKEADTFIYETIPSYYEIFTRKTCPQCPSVKQQMEDSEFIGTTYDVDSDEGFEAAKGRGVLSTPTVIFFDEAMSEIRRCHTKEEIYDYLGI